MDSNGTSNSSGVDDLLNLDSISEDFLQSIQQDLNELQPVEENTDNLESQLFQQQGNIFSEPQIQQGEQEDPYSPMLPFQVSSLFGPQSTAGSAHQSPLQLELGNDLDLETLIQNGLEENYHNKNLSSGQKSYQQRQRAVQEKNRRAQARFRERQKSKLSELSAQLEDLNLKVNSLSQENSNLQNKNTILEKVLSIRDEQLFSIMSAKREKFKNEGLISELPYEEENPTPLILSLRDDEAFSEFTQDKLHLSLLDQTFSMQEIKNLSLEQLSNIWKTYVNELGIILVSLDENVVNTEYVHMEKLVNEFTIFKMFYGILNPIGIKKWVTCRGNPQMLESQQQFQCDQSAVNECMHIVQSLGLTSQQTSEIIQLRSMFFENLRKCSNKRKEINQSLQFSLPNSEGGPQTARRFLQAHESLAGLKENLRKEHSILLDFVCSMYRRIFKPIQLAKLVVSSYPYSPDALIVAYCITQLPNQNNNNNNNNKCNNNDNICMHIGNQGQKSNNQSTNYINTDNGYMHYGNQIQNINNNSGNIYMHQGNQGQNGNNSNANCNNNDNIYMHQGNQGQNGISINNNDNIYMHNGNQIQINNNQQIGQDQEHWQNVNSVAVGVQTNQTNMQRQNINIQQNCSNSHNTNISNSSKSNSKNNNNSSSSNGYYFQNIVQVVGGRDGAGPTITTGVFYDSKFTPRRRKN